MSEIAHGPSAPIPKKQRALILQGGGALGAYEVGVFNAIYDKIVREEGEDNANRIGNALGEVVYYNHYCVIPAVV